MKAEELKKELKERIDKLAIPEMSEYILNLIQQYAAKVSRDEYEKGFCDGKKARMGRHKNFWA